MLAPNLPPPPPEPTRALWAGLLVYVLFLVLPAGLKLAGHLPYSWWWVLLALWLPVALMVLSLVYVVLVRLVKGRRV